MSHMLAEIEIKNFRSIKDAKFTLSDYTPLVGYNNAGKSNIIRAIGWLLNKSVLTENDFNKKNNSIEVSGVIGGITTELLDNIGDIHRKKIEPYINNEKLCIRRCQANPNVVAKDIVLEVLNPANGVWSKNPGGIDNAISVLFPEPIKIQAMQDVQSDISANKTSSTIGQILKEIIIKVKEKHKTSIESALDGILNMFSCNGNNRVQEFKDHETGINDKLKDFFPELSAKLHIPTPMIDDLFKACTLKIFDGTNHNDANYLGHGSVRAIQMALLCYLSDVINNSTAPGRKTLLLIDEPELYLHPQAIEKVRLALKSLSRGNFQVVFSTHSAIFIPPSDAINTLIVRKNTEKGTYALKTGRAASAAIGDAPHQAGHLFNLLNGSEILFTEKVIIGEGKSEILLPYIFEKTKGKTFLASGIGFVRTDGVSNYLKTRNILKEMGVGVKFIADIDFIFNNSKELDIETTPQYMQCITKLQSMAAQEPNKINLNGNRAQKCAGGYTAAEVYELLANQEPTNIQALHDKIKADFDIWVWTKGALEKHLNIPKDESTRIGKRQELMDGKDLAMVFPNLCPQVNKLMDWIEQ